MVNDYGSNTKSIICCVGPAISKCCYEIDKVCYNEFAKVSGLDLNKIMTSKGNGNIWQTYLKPTNKYL